MAKAHSSSTDSDDSSCHTYDSMDHYLKCKFVISDEEKRQCLDALHCSLSPVSKKPGAPQHFKTMTSHWNGTKNKGSSRVAVYKLFKVKRWYLKDVNFLFRPYDCQSETHSLTPGNSLFYKDTEEIDVCSHSLDGLLSGFKPKHFETLQKLDQMLLPLDHDLQTKHRVRPKMLFKQLGSRYLANEAFSMIDYSNFTRALGRAVLMCTENKQKIKGSHFQWAFDKFVRLISLCVGWREDDEVVPEEIICAPYVDGFGLERVILPVKIDGKEDILSIGCKPDLYVYVPTNLIDIGQRPRILAVIEVKGKRRGLTGNADEALASGSEEEDDDFKKYNEQFGMFRCTNALHDIEEEKETEEKSEDENFMDELLENSPKWLGSLKSDMSQSNQDAVKRFLPQLLGEMICVSRSENVCSFETESGIQLGIGVVGLDVYFVTVMNPKSGTTKLQLINDDSAYLNVFITRAFNILNKEDRRIIIKVIAIACQIHNIL